MARKLDVVVDSHATWVHAEKRADGRWQARLEFRSPSGSVWTPIQTTQSSEEAVEHWAGGLTVTHIQNAFRAATAPRVPHEAGVAAAPTPVNLRDRLTHLHQIEREILSLFGTLQRSVLPTAEFFARGPHANSDFIRAFEDLEKRWRYLARHTVNGLDLLELTPAGAEAAGMPAEMGTSAPLQRPKPMA